MELNTAFINFKQHKSFNDIWNNNFTCNFPIEILEYIRLLKPI